ncbi:MAG: Rrf2 family transcriptional regulator [Deltaproteobacteria bacterium]|nr:Rrf2 family transcriptional regulator [Deltaproteobacteria bacterium]
MFRLSRASEYAIRGILYLSSKPEFEVCCIEEVAKAQDVPSAYLSKLFQSLVKKGYMRSFRGTGGGFALAKNPKDITLLEIIEIIEGGMFLNDCMIREGYCRKDASCHVHNVWKTAQQRFLDYLRQCNFEQLSATSSNKD